MTYCPVAKKCLATLLFLVWPFFKIYLFISFFSSGCIGFFSLIQKLQSISAIPAQCPEHIEANHNLKVNYSAAHIAATNVVLTILCQLSSIWNRNMW